MNTENNEDIIVDGLIEPPPIGVSNNTLELYNSYVRNRTIANRKSKCGHTSKNPWYLSEDSEVFETLFDSLVVGQWVGGIDSRNTGGTKVTNYENESALYSIKEMPFHWKKNKNTFLWQPLLDGRILATVHVHSKALDCFLSDRPDYPKDDYEVNKIYNTLLPN